MPQIAGPSGALTYSRDAWGYPRIAVRDHREAAWSAGYLHATDRRLQVRLQLMAAQGRMMELLGDRPLSRTIDRSVRTVGINAGLDQQVERLSESTLRFAESYCAGFNAGVRADRSVRAVAVRALGLDDEPMTPAHMIALYRLTTWFGLNSLTQSNALVLALLASRFADRLRSRDDLRLLWGDGARDIDLDACAEVQWPRPLEELLIDRSAPRGSNAFAVSGAHTVSGAPLMMSEFHLEVGQIPPLLYAMHFDLADGGDGRPDFLHGVSVPGLPTIAAGRNRDAAWTYTFGHAANVDVWLERCERGHRVSEDGAVPLEARIEHVKIRRGPLRPTTSEQWTFWESEHGTISGDAERGGTFASVRWRGLERTFDDLDHLTRVVTARSVDELIELHRGVSAAALAGTFIDRAGGLGYVQTGSVDDRHGRWGPRPGWVARDRIDDGRGPAEAVRPTARRPAEGFIVSANEHHEHWTAFAEPRHRFDRVRDRVAQLVARGGVEPDDLIDVSYDAFDGLAATLAEAWSTHLEAFDGARGMLDWARRQPDAPDDHGHHRVRWHALHREAIRGLLSRRFDADTAAWMLRDPAVLLGLHLHLDEVLVGRHPDLLGDPELGEIVRDAWRSIHARDIVEGVDGPALEKLRFRHVLEEGLPATPLSGPEVELSGGPVSPFQMRVSEVRGHRIVTGPAFHLILDMSTDVTRYNIAGGASELPFGPGYAAGIDAWHAGAFIELGKAP